MAVSTSSCLHLRLTILTIYCICLLSIEVFDTIELKWVVQYNVRQIIEQDMAQQLSQYFKSNVDFTVIVNLNLYCILLLAVIIICLFFR